MSISAGAAWRVARRAYFVAAVLGAAFGALAFPAWGQVGETGGIGGTGISSGTGGIGGTGIHSETGGIGGTGAPIVGYGPIQAFGSVFINGREYEIGRSTHVIVNGKPASFSDLHVGDLAKVQGVTTTAGHGIARRIMISYPISGPITAIAAKRDALEVVGQHIMPANPAMMAGLQVGQAVAVSAQQRPDGTWVAYRIAPYSSPARFRLEGKVTAAGGNVLQVSGAKLAFQGALPAGASVGERVVVTGEVGARGFKANHIAPAPMRLGALGTRIEVHDYFRSVGQGRLIAADGLAAIGAPADMQMHGAVPIQISGYISARGVVQIEHLEIVAPPPASLPSRSKTRSEGAVTREGKGPASGAHAAHDVSELGSRKPETSEPQAEQPEGRAHKIESPDIELPGVEAPEVEPPEVEPPEVEPPEVEPPEAEPPEVETPDN